MNPRTAPAIEAIRKSIAQHTEPLSDDDYLDVLEEVSADIEGMIDAKREEMPDD